MVGARRDRTHDIHLFLSGCTEIYPRSGHAEISPREDSPGGLLRRAQKEGAWPLHSQPCSVSSPALWSHTHCAPSRCSDLGVSGLRNPGPNPRPSPTLRQDRPGSRGRSSPSPGPRQRTGKPGRKGKGGGARRLETPPLPGIPSSQAALRPFFSLPYPRGQRWGREPAGGPWVGEGARRGWRLQPSGRKVGRRQAEGIPARPGLLEEALAYLLVPRPGSRDGRQRLGTDWLGAGLRAPGAGSAAPGARSPHPTGAAAVSAPPLGSGSGARRAARARAGGGVGGGPRLGSAWGLGPQAGSAPERRAPDSARGAPPALRVKSWAPAGAHTPALTWGRPATESGPRGHDRRAQTRHTRGYTHSPPETLCYSHLRLRGQANTLAHARYTLTHAH